jgi:predicted DNA-binding transcriptional regulator YafY
MSRPTGRVLTLLELLQSGGVRTVAELAERLSVDGRTVRRYVDQLAELDVPVEAVRGRYGGYRLGSGYRLPPLMLSDDEALAVLLGLLAGRRSGLIAAAGAAAGGSPGTGAGGSPGTGAGPSASGSAGTGAGTGAGTSAGTSAGPSAGGSAGTSAGGSGGGSPGAGVGASTGPSAGGLADTASETAAAKIRRVLPARLARRLDALLESLAFTAAPGEAAPPDAEVLLTVADAVRHRRPLTLRYTDRHGRRTERPLHPYGVVAHAGRWYVTGFDPAKAEDRTFRLDRVATARPGPGTFEPPAGPGPAERVVAALATAPYRHEVSVRIRTTPAHVRTRLPPTVATLTESATAPGWLRVDIRAESLDWLPPLLAALDRPFVIDGPPELRSLVADFATRLAASAAAAPGTGAVPAPVAKGDDDMPPPRSRNRRSGA